jgi:hypothetical protein
MPLGFRQANPALHVCRGLWLAAWLGGLPLPARAGTVLVSESDAGRIRRYQTDCLIWTDQPDFASGMINGQALQSPLGMAVDAAGRVYVAEQRSGGRVLRFTGEGVWLDSLGREGIEFSGNPHSLTTGPDGAIYLSTAFGSGAGKVYRIDPTTGTSTRIIASGLDTPRSLAFDPSGSLWIANRGTFSGSNGYLSRWNGSILETVATSLSRPSALAWDPVGLRLITTLGGNPAVAAVEPNGSRTTVYQSSGTNYLGLASIEGHLYFTDYDGNSVRAVLAQNSSRQIVGGLNKAGHLLALSETPHDGPCEDLVCPPLPGIPLAYSPPSSKLYLGSPMLVRCQDGSLLASHDYYGSASTQSTAGQTLLYRSTNEGLTWLPLGDLKNLTLPAPDTDGVFWHGLFRRDTSLFSMGAESTAGNLVIRRSDDHGAYWTDVSASRGNLIATTDGRAWACGPLIHEQSGRFWAALEHQISGTWGDNEIRVIAAERQADLLQTSSWQQSNTLRKSNTWLGGTFRAWLEASPVETRNGGLLIGLRVDNRYSNGSGIGGKAAFIRVDNPNAATPSLSFNPVDFDPTAVDGSGFVDFPGGAVRFVIRYDRPSDRYWSVCSYIPRAFRKSTYNAERFRAVLALVSSDNLKDWSVERILMHDPRIYSQDPAVLATAFDGSNTDYGFQYPWFLIESDELLVTVRTAYSDLEGGAAAGHDANYHLFMRVPDFRRRSSPGDLQTRRIDRSADGTCTIAFQGRPTRTYRLQSSRDLSQWIDAGLSLESPGGESRFIHHPGNSNAQFYRIVENGDSWLE